MAYRYRKVTKGLSVNAYDTMRNLYHSVKPIRGSDNLRPIANRRHQDERIAQGVLADGSATYSALFRNHEAVTYYPDGTIALRGGGACGEKVDFLNAHSPFRFVYQYQHMWCLLNSLYIPVIGEGLLMTPNGEGRYSTPQGVIHQRVIDRAKIKIHRERYKPFLNWARVFLEMADGWLCVGTGKELSDHYKNDPRWFRGTNNLGYCGSNGKTFLKYGDMSDTELYPHLLFSLFDGFYGHERRVSSTATPPPDYEPGKFHMWDLSLDKYDKRVRYSDVPKIVEQVILKYEDVYTIRHRPPDTKPIGNTIAFENA